MEAVKHGMKPRKGGPSQAVASDFIAADKAKGKRSVRKLPPRAPSTFSGRAKPKTEY
jgi:hypothetical protein